MKPIFEYDDCRQYLLDVYWERKKEKNKLWTRRGMAANIPLKSSSQFDAIIKGLGLIRTEMLPGFLRMCGHSASSNEGKYFIEMVHYTQSEGTLKIVHLEKMKLLRVKQPIRLQKGPSEVFNNWYTPAVLNTLKLRCIQDNSSGAAELAALIYPPLTPGQINESIRVLKKRGFLDAENGYLTVKKDQFQFDADRMGSLIAQVCDNASNAHDNLDPEETNYVMMWANLDPPSFKKACGMLESLKQEVLALDSGKENAPSLKIESQTFQLLFSIFPISQKPSKKKQAV